MTSRVVVSTVGRVLRLELDNPPANALSIAVIAELQQALDQARESDGISVVIIGARRRLFCGGHDLKELTAHRSDPDRGRAFFEHTFEQCSKLMRSIVELPQPVIAKVQGIATAAGCQLVASCDLAYASEEAAFGVNGINVGLFCSTPAVPLTRNVPMKRAMEMLLTGAMIDARTAIEIGLVNRAVPPSSLGEVVDEVAEVIASKSASAVRIGKTTVRQQAGLGLADAYACASRAIVDNLLLPDAEKGIGNFLSKRS